jgi:hypothetical protein
MMAIPAQKTRVMRSPENAVTKHSTANNSVSLEKPNVVRDAVFKANAFPLTAAAVFVQVVVRKAPVFQEAAKR